MNVQDANMQDVLAAYFDGTGAARAAAHLQQEIQAKHHLQLAALLRDHRDRAVFSPSEITLRSAFDDLMLCCEVMEIAVLTGFVAPPTQSGFWDTIAQVLENQQVRRFYSEYYPTKLPQLMRFRILGRHTTIDGGPMLPVVMIEFLALDRRFMSTLNDGYLLRMLDSFTIGGWDFGDIVALLAEPQEVLRRILRAPHERGIPGTALYEFTLFMQFSFDLHRLLERLVTYPLLQSEIWHHYGYWCGIIGPELRDQLGRALDQFLHWEPQGSRDVEIEEIQAEVARARVVVEDLTSPRYSVVADRLVSELTRI